MALPKIAKITHELVVPSTGKKIKFRPFLVKEEKVLILAQETGSQKEMIRAIKDVIDACVQTRGFKVDELATFDVEYIFLNIRGKSVGESVDLIVTCPDDGVTKVDVTVFLDEIKVIFDDEHKDHIKLDDTWSVKMKYPDIDTVLSSDGENISIDDSLELIASCVDVIYSEEDSYSSSDSSLKEIVEWVEELEQKQFQELEQFFTTMPKLSSTVQVLNPKTGVTSDIVLEGLGSFFA